ncbi:MAG: GNAT family N-acetyltransferase [Aliishimia sp.]
MQVQQWPSLSAQLTLSKRLFGVTGPELLQNWLDDQAARINDLAFARLFSAHITLPGISEQDFNHRHVTAQNGSLLGGIRFFGGNAERPFVELIAHTFQESAGGIEALASLVRSEWRAFKPENMRLLLTPEQLNSFESAQSAFIDMSIHAARYEDIKKPNGRVELATFNNATAAIEIVEQRYRDVSEHDPDLAQNISAADPQDVQEWYDAGQIQAITAKDKTVGLLAIAPGNIEWMTGDEVNEEVISTPHTGKGYASEAQKAWAEQAQDQDKLLLGTIDRLNPASRKTAEAVGRKAVLNYVFISLSR